MFGVGGYLFGKVLLQLHGAVGPIAFVLATAVLLGGGFLMRRFEIRLSEAAERALPGPLESVIKAKEYIAAQDEDNPGVLVLSRFAGAAPECVGALLVNPYDPESVAGAIANALEMPLAERKERHAATLSRLRQNGGNVWSENFLNSLRLMGNGLPVEDEERAEWAGSTGIDRILATQRP